MNRLKFALSIPWSGNDFKQILSAMNESDLEYIDLRGVGDKHVMDLSDTEAQELKELIKKRGVKVSSISPYLFFRLPLTVGENEITLRGTYAEHIDMLKRAIELARIFETDLVRSFSFETEFLFSPSGYRDLPFDVWEKTIERLKKAADIAEAAGITLGIENCHWNNLGTGYLVAKAIDEIGSRNVRLWWDPTNSAMTSGENPYPDEYELVKDYITIIDMKDSIIDKRYSCWSHVAMGQGNKVDWESILKALVRDNYQRIITYESCYVPQDGTISDGIRESFLRIGKWLA